jgi:hypothetical protein
MSLAPLKRFDYPVGGDEICWSRRSIQGPLIPSYSYSVASPVNHLEQTFLTD